MCILFIYSGQSDESSEYSLILISNRDEFYDRPSLNAAPWPEDQNIIGGRDMVAGGTWLAISPLKGRLGILLNLPGNKKDNAKSRGKIVDDLVKSDVPIAEYINCINTYAMECNDFQLVIAEFSESEATVHTFNNVTNKLEKWSNQFLGFGNSLPDAPLKKVEAGKNRLKEICSKYNTIALKDKLVHELIKLLRWNERHLPDHELKRRNPVMYETLASVYVCEPEARYGSRTHSIVLVTKTGSVDFIEVTMQSPIDPLSPDWLRNDFHFNI